MNSNAEIPRRLKNKDKNSLRKNWNNATLQDSKMILNKQNK